ncbi:MAG: transketolase [Neisseriaceae bacterium]|nr:MAG: transketolase [Neisseriaceae bacterium]
MMSPLANAVRFLSIDAIQKANSGHPGAPMGMAEMATVLWTKHLQHNPENPNFINRDRFILSNGHASMLLYSVLHLTGYDLSIEDLKQFRQYKSKTPGHPEYGYTDGVETTTGPLGQGIANAVGFALAEKILASEFNQPNFDIVNHHTYVFVGDGCLMEGISHEACSLAGTLGLGKLIVLYDDNNISIDGKVEGWFTEDIPMRFEAYNWQVIPNVDGHNMEEIDQAIQDAKSNTSQPTLICCKTTIGKGASSKEGSEKTHGSPLGEEEVNNTRKKLNWNYLPFEIPQEIYEQWNAKAKGKQLEDQWDHLFKEYRHRYPKLAQEFERRIARRLPENYLTYVNQCIKLICDKKENIASRKASQESITLLTKILPELVGGSADLTPSNLTNWPQSVSITKDDGGNYIHYGVREFAMVAIVNGIFLHSGIRPFGATFLMFSEYARNALRMAALMKIGSIFVFTHDSIGLGEDGPTHQPIEQIASLRLIPNIQVWRPCDSIESFIAWSNAIQTLDKPSVLIFSRQNLPYIERDDEQINNISKGGYIVHRSNNPQVIIIATGSEVGLALKAQLELAKQEINVNVVSMPSTNIFDEQDNDYKLSILPTHLPKVVIEAGVTDLWYKYIGSNDRIIGINYFGESAPADILFEKFNFTVSHVVNTILDIVKLN